MDPKLIAKIIASVSLLLAIILIICSSLFLVDWLEWHSNCHKMYDDLERTGYYGHSPCKRVDYFIAGAACGISAGIIGLFATVLVLFQKWRIWCILHVVIFILAIIAFALPFDQGADNIINPLSDPAYKKYQHRANAHLAFSVIYFIFAPIGVGIVFCLTKNAR